MEEAADDLTKDIASLRAVLSETIMFDDQGINFMFGKVHVYNIDIIDIHMSIIRYYRHTYIYNIYDNMQVALCITVSVLSSLLACVHFNCAHTSTAVSGRSHDEDMIMHRYCTTDAEDAISVAGCINLIETQMQQEASSSSTLNKHL